MELLTTVKMGFVPRRVTMHKHIRVTHPEDVIAQLMEKQSVVLITRLTIAGQLTSVLLAEMARNWIVFRHLNAIVVNLQQNRSPPAMMGRCSVLIVLYTTLSKSVILQ